MPEFTTAEEYVAYRVFVQRLDGGGRTWFEVVDRFTPPPTSKILGEFDTIEAANEKRDETRAKRVAEVLSGALA